MALLRLLVVDLNLHLYLFFLLRLGCCLGMLVGHQRVIIVGLAYRRALNKHLVGLSLWSFLFFQVVVQVYRCVLF